MQNMIKMQNRLSTQTSNVMELIFQLCMHMLWIYLYHLFNCLFDANLNKSVVRIKFER